MTRTKLEKIKLWIARCRRKPNNHRELEAILLKLERKRVKRGKEPTYESVAFPDANMITVPDHPGRDIRPGTAANILNQCEEDVFRFQEQLDEEARRKAKQRGQIQYDDSGYTH